MSLGSVIDDLIDGWEGSVEIAIFGTRSGEAVAQIVDGFARSVLGSGIERYTFYRSNIASVHGVALQDGRRVVIKAHKPDILPGHLSAITDLQRRLTASDPRAPRPLIDPSPLGTGVATVEEERTGERGDAHEPEIRRGMAQGLAELVDRCRTLSKPEPFPVDRSLTLPTGRLWPTPHSTLFDFESTAAGAERIDGVATAARRILDGIEPADLVGHTDWRSENMRFRGDRIAVVYDWESLARTTEPVLVGGAAHAFCADWHEPASRPRAPSPDEARSFVRDYLDASGRRFGREGLAAAGAAYAFATAYTARCEHALDPSADSAAGDGFRNLIDEHGNDLLRAFED